MVYVCFLFCYGLLSIECISYDRAGATRRCRHPVIQKRKKQVEGVRVRKGERGYRGAHYLILPVNYPLQVTI